MSNSFYGGRDAAPMVIKKSFTTVQAMVDKFKEGNNYREVKFGEYVLIQSVNKNNPENGMLFRRGRAYNNENLKIQSWSQSTDNIFTPTDILAYGAEHLGTITGPSGNAPHLHFKQKETEVREEYQNNETSAYEIKTGSGEFSLNAGNLVPGNPNSKITWTYCSIRDNNGNNTNAYIGFTIPYNVTEWGTEQLSSQQNVTLTNEQITPFYQKYKLGIPKGQDGTSFNNIRVITPTASDKVVTITFDSNRNITATDYAGLQDDISNKRKIWVADIVDYKVTDNGTQYLVYLGDYNTIKNISLTDKGVFKIEYHHEDAFTKNLKWPISTSLAADGTYTTFFNDESFISQEGDNRLKWINSIRYDSTDGTFYITYNTDSSQEYPIGVIGSSTLDAVAANEENIDTASLKTRGIWFVTQEWEG